jgi:hypothetical protein
MNNVKLDLASMTMQQYADYIAAAHPDWGSWKRKHPFNPEIVLYLNAWTRFRIVTEQHTECGFGLDRLDEAHGKDIDIDGRDSREFARSFMNTIGNKMSLFDLNIFLDEVRAVREEWSTERIVAIQRTTNDK